MNDNISSGTVSVYLNRLTNATLQDFNGKKCMVIPIEDNNIYISDKGTVMLAMFMEKLNTPNDYGKTHFLRRKVTKAELSSMTVEQKNKLPILGYFSPFVAGQRNNQYNNASDFLGNNGGYQQNNNQYAAPRRNAPYSSPQRPSNGGSDDMPF